MSFRTITTALLLATIARVTVATPPACLIAAVNTQPNPAGVSFVCSGSNATQVESYMQSHCGNALDDATSAWTGFCGDAGVQIVANSSSSSSSGSSTIILSSQTSSGASVSPSSGSSSSATEFSSPAESGSSSSSSGSSSSFPSSAAASSSGSSSSQASSSSKTGSATASASNAAFTGAASRVGMDILGMAALGIMGAMLALNAH